MYIYSFHQQRLRVLYTRRKLMVSCPCKSIPLAKFNVYKPRARHAGKSSVLFQLFCGSRGMLQPIQASSSLVCSSREKDREGDATDAGKEGEKNTILEKQTDLLFVQSLSNIHPDETERTNTPCAGYCTKSRYFFSNNSLAKCYPQLR